LGERPSESGKGSERQGEKGPGQPEISPETAGNFTREQGCWVATRSLVWGGDLRLTRRPWGAEDQSAGRPRQAHEAFGTWKSSWADADAFASAMRLPWRSASRGITPPRFSKDATPPHRGWVQRAARL